MHLGCMFLAAAGSCCQIEKGVLSWAGFRIDSCCFAFLRRRETTSLVTAFNLRACGLLRVLCTCLGSRGGALRAVSSLPINPESLSVPAVWRALTCPHQHYKKKTENERVSQCSIAPCLIVDVLVAGLNLRGESRAQLQAPGMEIKLMNE